MVNFRSLWVRFEAALIRSRDSFNKAPRLMLITGDYPITSASLLQEASRLLIVPGGNLSKSQVFLAHEIHMVGGHPTACLANTLADMLPASPGSSHDFEIAVGRGKRVQITFVR